MRRRWEGGGRGRAQEEGRELVEVVPRCREGFAGESDEILSHSNMKKGRARGRTRGIPSTWHEERVGSPNGTSETLAHNILENKFGEVGARELS